MKPLRLATWVSDHTNPVVVKELRQAVRSRVFVGVFMLLLGVCVVISLSAASEGGQDSGMETYRTFLICLAIAGCTVLPTTPRGASAVRIVLVLFFIFQCAAFLPGLSSLGVYFFSYSPIMAMMNMYRMDLFAQPGFWTIVLCQFVVQGSYVVVLYFLAVSRLTFPTANRSTAVRAALIGQTVLLLGLGFLGLSGAANAPFWWSRLGSALILQWGFVGIFMTTEPDTMSRRVAQSVPRSRLRRILAVPFWPGGARGWSCLLLAFGLILAVTTLGGFLAPAGGVRWAGLSTVLAWTPLFQAARIVLILGLSHFLLHTLPTRRFTPYAKRLIIVIALPCPTIVPILLEFLFGLRPFESQILHSLDPFATILMPSRAPGFSLFLMILASVVALLCLVPVMASGARTMHEAHRRNMRHAIDSHPHRAPKRRAAHA
ncbi:hypothetical protein HQ560_01165 [bacterium]|nr:hypothetical protein [bacterium]